jgi:hypothetical protein
MQRNPPYALLIETHLYFLERIPPAAEHGPAPETALYGYADPGFAYLDVHLLTF